MSTVTKCDRCNHEITSDQDRVRLTVEVRPSYNGRKTAGTSAAEVLEQAAAIENSSLRLDLHHRCYIEHYESGLRAR